MTQLLDTKPPFPDWGRQRGGVLLGLHFFAFFGEQKIGVKNQILNIFELEMKNHFEK